MSKYYDISTLLSYNKILNFIIGQRGGGKTFGAKKWCINDFLKKENQFIWVRSGEGRFDIADDTVYLGQGQGMFMRCRVPHSYTRSGDNFHTCFCTFFSSDNLIEYCIGELSPAA